MDIEIFSDRGALAQAAADAIADALSRPGPVSFVAAGGSTPAPTYDRLARMDLGWSRVTVTLGDDRWVDPASPDSNEPLIRKHLLTGRAAAARFLPLKGDGDSPEADAVAIEPTIAALAPFDVVMLGMGEDGHTASLFPRNPPPPPERLCVGVPKAGLAPFVPRLTMTPTALTRTRALIVLITGEAKRAIVERVRAQSDFSPPVAAILRQDRRPARILWAL
jgi:6-phosphogluconolactonase